ncbi:peptidylprolyl isomerase [Oceanotoga sp. DSM 15011]|uniref:Peptidyl-prolyl cis-trans isomerase C n=1 Tax=Oceanotoga teriensis TaxID=515440 RepID=A0AA45C5P0_9BACT|nr:MULTISPECIES: peptidylprolyl isomerase [Oceanotoga]MDN5341709.1 peptidyl-prolyl cis-trans isomerase [Oceanotoga sp.]PWJ89288.1 peptidyl-prolyl cis-trans isomerase C [Oceanotoga teriensis]UYO98855.1 peptidylprolyl isomerase [Oceanotoga sp. DSM 15011]
MSENKVLATVNGKEITQKDVDILLQRIGPQRAAQFQTPQGQESLLRELINQELMYLEALDTDLDKDEQFLKEVELAKREILKQFAIGRLFDTIEVTDEDAKNYYDENTNAFQQGEQVKASHILVDSEDKANEIIKELENGKSFEDAAKEYSSCPSKNNGGDLGFFGKGQMVPEFEQAAFKMNKEDLSEPVKTQFGFHIIKLTDKKEASVMKFDEVKDNIKQQLMVYKQSEIYMNKGKELEKKYEVIINK